jgi:membrane protein
LSRKAVARLWRAVLRSASRGWNRTLPGAIVATVAWFGITLSFGWYVTRFANYSQVYGPLGAGIALLVWLYIVFFSVLLGAEFNAQFRSSSHAPPVPGTNPDAPNAIG